MPYSTAIILRLSLHNPAGIKNRDLIAAQLLYEIALWSIRCLDGIQDERPEILQKFAPETDVWPVLFRKVAQVKQTIIPRLEKISFAEKVVIGKGKMPIDEGNFWAIRVMELITIIEYIQAGRVGDVSCFFQKPIPQEIIDSCCSLPENKEEGAEAWWAVLVQLPPLVYGDLGSLPVDHPLTKNISKDFRNDPSKRQGTARPGTQRGRINDAIRNAFDSLTHRRLRKKVP
jgi:hypothetical protein